MNLVTFFPVLMEGRVAMLMIIALTAAVLVHTLVISVVSVILIDFIIVIT